MSIEFLVKCIFILSGELKRKDDLLASMDKKQDEAREKMQEVTIHCHLSEETLNKLPIKRAHYFPGPNADAETPSCPQLMKISNTVQ